MSVRVIDYRQRESFDGETMFSLIVIGEPEVVLSKSTQKPYLTARKASLITTFSESVCKSMIGSYIPGQIVKVELDKPVEIKDSEGFVTKIKHRWEYIAEEPSDDSTMETQMELELKHGDASKKS